MVKGISHRVVGGVFGPGTADTQSTMAARPLFNWSRVLGCHEAVPWPKEPQGSIRHSVKVLVPAQLVSLKAEESSPLHISDH